ncbi:helix-turn-helix transcriptional regulator [Niabella drilacis]|uniref:Transcriptional regulator n=1 Tax=Niabella drilacis (strain DSM 25811 / CCM 8410 / CCUG 62505 / LMG 26954 / E90) TaxID=1285928 RepID=A0A1G6L913_NIADE|nr:metalloregulator ArsR/SmtB family transcription factor [Niabella drilacis]SDC39623.1 transcriptional regulator [Niabella drilacis]
MHNELPENEKALGIIKVKGPQTLLELAAEMNITVEGARFHLLKLAKEGLVQATTESKGRGRPQQIWALTDLGNARFPDMHAELTVKLIDSVRNILGQPALDKIVAANGKAGLERYLKELEEKTDLKARLKGLAAIRTREGYMADVQKDGDGYLLVENHCPICAAAASCQGFCTAELKTFKAVLGKKVNVERVAHILKGARRCAYKITPAG